MGSVKPIAPVSEKPNLVGCYTRVYAFGRKVKYKLHYTRQICGYIHLFFLFYADLKLRYTYLYITYFAMDKCKSTYMKKYYSTAFITVPKYFYMWVNEEITHKCPSYTGISAMPFKIPQGTHA